MFAKVLVANRGEIAIRAFRTAFELGTETVAIYTHEDRTSMHRSKADEAYLIGTEGHAVKAYLDVDAIVAVATSAGAEAIYPGYGFLSENPRLAAACRDAGITFIGPPAEVLELTGNKATAVAAAEAAGVPTLKSTAPSSDHEHLVAEARALRYPLFVKAVAGGGGRGMRRVDRPDDLRAALSAAGREGQAAFGDGTLFIEEAVIDPRHIEVQILADGQGNVVHLLERDCSLQRRHQKVVEIAPAPNLAPEVREQLCADAVRFAQSIQYRGAGTVEFLVDAEQRHFFIEMNPRIQVEHTVTEEITDIDIVAAQFRVAAGVSLAEQGITQDRVQARGYALQCRITTEDPENDFRPQTGQITAYRSPGGPGLRIDGEIATGTEISAHFDSLLVKVTARATTFPAAVDRARRALAEFRVRGIATNIPFLQAVLDEPDFRAGKTTTSFIPDHPHLLDARRSRDRSSKLLDFLADVTVNAPHPRPPVIVDPRQKLPAFEATAAPRPGSKQLLDEVGPERFAAALRQQRALAVTDTTFRDAHQSLLATRVRSTDLLAVAPAVSRMTPELLSLECWGGATYDVALRFLHEDPWERLAAIHDAVPNICLQMLLRGRNTVGYTPYPDEVAAGFIAEATRTGIDIFRIFDALNNTDSMLPAIRAVRDNGAVAEVALSYTGNLTDKNETLYTLDYYLRLAEQAVDAGAHILAIKDMAGLLRPEAARRLITALRERFDLPVHLHTHDTAGGQLATYWAAIEAGVDAVDGAAASLAGSTSQPSLSSIVAVTDDSDRATGLDLTAVCDLEPYWAAVRQLYAPFESGLRSPTGRVYEHEIPGGQLSNLHQQARALGLAERFEDIEEAYAGSDRILGRLVKVTPSSKVVGDLALHLVGTNTTPDEFAAHPERTDVPDSVVSFFRGELGTPAGGWPTTLREAVLQGRPGTVATAQVTDDQLDVLTRPGAARRELLNALLFPGPTREYERFVAAFGDVSIVDTATFWYGVDREREHTFELEPGVTVLVVIQAVSNPDEKGMRTVVFQLNGSLRPIRVLDRSLTVETPRAEKADPTKVGHVGAPFAGVVTPVAAVGDRVESGAVIATIEAMKMEASISAPRSGLVSRVALTAATSVEGGDLIAIIDTGPTLTGND